MKPVYALSRPASSTSMSLKTSPCSATSSDSRRSRRSLSSGARLRQRPSSKDRRALATASSRSSAPPQAARPISSPVAGWMIGIVSPEREATTFPSMTWPIGRRVEVPVGLGRKGKAGESAGGHASTQ